MYKSNTYPVLIQVIPGETTCIVYKCSDQIEWTVGRGKDELLFNHHCFIQEINKLRVLHMHNKLCIEIFNNPTLQKGALALQNLSLTLKLFQCLKIYVHIKLAFFAVLRVTRKKTTFF